LLFRVFKLVGSLIRIEKEEYLNYHYSELAILKLRF